MVHGAGGTLLEHLKELRLHSGLGPADALLFQTNCAWMMWHWMVSGLAVGAEIVLFDGSVSYPTPDRLLRTADALGVTHLGSNPTYLQFLRDTGSTPSGDLAFRRLRAVLSTGSVLPDQLYDWVNTTIAHVPLQSISGGTDIIGCFVLGNPLLPVFRGESQCISLGLDVQAMTDEGPRRTGRGELVCAAPFPSRPLYFIGDTDNHRYHEAYFAQHAGLWTHGDLVELTERGTARVLGRSDGTLNVRGVRIGPAEIHSVVLGLPEVAHALAVEQQWPQEPGGSRIALLLVLKDGVLLDRPLTLRLKRELATRASANHVPGLVVQVPELPMTFSGKVSARAARDALNGVTVVNRAALRNPTVLEHLAGFAPTPGRPAA
jgi:acetoacetyl-CoA synthetase